MKLFIFSGPNLLLVAAETREEAVEKVINKLVIEFEKEPNKEAINLEETLNLMKKEMMDDDRPVKVYDIDTELPDFYEWS
jgi:hypothetical protein